MWAIFAYLDSSHKGCFCGRLFYSASPTIIEYSVANSRVGKYHNKGKHTREERKKTCSFFKRQERRRVMPIQRRGLLVIYIYRRMNANHVNIYFLTWEGCLNLWIYGFPLGFSLTYSGNLRGERVGFT